ncbi:MAG: 23S rRNA pseudouridine synthase [Candidatus Peregrinibacteria bacterium Greene0416_62]|nr:MAG: 23S rRNA pseudouridine synthase [Candidatus Peregrinibacteria bacterium Greene0416_62]TSC99766.1 MAG: 23S rRNA pseudouridine synthase [Candidatus Peregrinibacteria bacterium Greene1014_49]
MQERLQKILSARGICSRRKAEEYIERGLVRVNGKAAILGQKADPAVDTIEVDGAVVQERKEMLYYVMHKPVGVETTNVERIGGAAVTRGISVRDLLPKELRGKVFPIGRLDKDSEGLLLFTNDGVLAYRLTHPKFDHEKEYMVIVDEPITDGQLRKLREGVTLFGEKTKPAKITRMGDKQFLLALTQGKNRQIRRMCQKVGVEVLRLERVRIMMLKDEKLKEGQIRALRPVEVEELLKAIGV